jgi:hypothetical protein
MNPIKALVTVTLAMIAITGCGSSSRPSASPAASPVSAEVLPAFNCSDQAGNGWPGPGTAQSITDVRTTHQSGYDRFVVQFSGAVPGYRVRQQAGSIVRLDPSDMAVKLDGSAALIVSLNPASANGSYSGSKDIKAGEGTLREARQLGDFEAVNTWGLGLSTPACFRAFTLNSPARLVIDVQSP